MTSQLQLGDVVVDVVHKDIKNLHLSVHPPTGRVTIAAPLRMKPEAIRVFAITKLGWIKQQQLKQRAQPREAPRDYIERESHYVWGRRYLLSVIEQAGPPRVELCAKRLILRVRAGTNQQKREAVMEKWYRSLVREACPSLVSKWENLLCVKVMRTHVQRMKTRWGSCNPQANAIRLNTELAKKPRECLEYIVVHEMAHLIERTHNARFHELMNRHLPHWQMHRALLSQLPMRDETWIG